MRREITELALPTKMAAGSCGQIKIQKVLYISATCSKNECVPSSYYLRLDSYTIKNMISNFNYGQLTGSSIVMN